MKTRVLTATAIALLAAALGVGAGTASSTAKIKICGQIKHGPKTTYTSTALHKKLSGTTWTVFATGVPCALGMNNARPILRWFAKAKVGATNYRANGFGCSKEEDGHGHSGRVGCYYANGKGNANIVLAMTGKYTIAQLKRLLGIR